MSVYEFCLRDETGKEHLTGILPERVTKESILNWVWGVIGDHSDINNIYFVQVEMN